MGFSLKSKTLKKEILILNKRVILHKYLVLPSGSQKVLMFNYCGNILVLCNIFADKFQL